MNDPSVSAQPPAVRVYTSSMCAYCIRAKMLLAKRGIAYEEINVSGDHAARAWLVEATGRRTVPQIFIHGKPVGGFDELVALDRAGELVPLVSAG